MWLRRAFYRWLMPAAFLLPLWLLIGWGIFNAGGWSFIWVLFIAIPSVFLGQLLLTLLVRSRPSARSAQAVSWWDVVGFTLWHGLTIAVGCYPESWFGLLLTGAIVTGIALIWLMLWQLWSEAKGSGIRVVSTAWRPPAGESAPPTGGAVPRHPEPRPDSVHDVIVVRESPREE